MWSFVVCALITDDNETNRGILHKQLTSWGMKDEITNNGAEALEMLRGAAEGGEAYDLAILDLHMPGMNGIELARAIKDDPAVASTRLMLLTSIGADVTEEARRAGIEAILSKPVRQSHLHDAIATMMSTTAKSYGRSAHEGVAPALQSKTVVETPPFRGHILLAEDNLVNQRVALKMLERLGYRSDAVSNGREAVEALSHGTYAAILMDIQMPEMDGFEATKEIRRHESRERHIPIIAMTANAMEGDREK